MVTSGAWECLVKLVLNLGAGKSLLVSIIIKEHTPPSRGNNRKFKFICKGRKRDPWRRSPDDTWYYSSQGNFGCTRVDHVCLSSPTDRLFSMLSGSFLRSRY